MPLFSLSSAYVIVDLTTYSLHCVVNPTSVSCPLPFTLTYTFSISVLNKRPSRLAWQKAWLSEDQWHITAQRLNNLHTTLFFLSIRLHSASNAAHHQILATAVTCGTLFGKSREGLLTTSGLEAGSLCNTLKDKYYLYTFKITCEVSRETAYLAGIFPALI